MQTDNVTDNIANNDPWPDDNEKIIVPEVMPETPISEAREDEPIRLLKTGKKTPKVKYGSITEQILTLTTTTPATQAEIARTLGTSRTFVHQVLERYGIKPNTVESFKKHQSDIYAGIREIMIDKLAAGLPKVKVVNSRDVKDMSTAISIIHEKENLSRGLATEITDYRSVVLEVNSADLILQQQLEQIKKQKEKPDEQE